ncbi:MAG: hypothetical protein ACI9T7_000640 [Oleiphilaceae bacterium]|jgi:hypothetical protein
MNTIKVIVSSLTLVLFSMGAQASWYCEADSHSARGWGSAHSRSQASDIALRECAIRTPYDEVCYITRCNRTRGVSDDKGGELTTQDTPDRTSLLESIDTKSIEKDEMKQGEKK